MYKNFDPHKPYFYGVALAFIIFGSAIVAIGIVEWIVNLYSTNNPFLAPSFKVIAGVIVTALGYIHLELELLRIQSSTKKKD